MAQLIKTKGWIFVDNNQLHITVIDKPYWVESEKYWRAKNGTELLPRELFSDMKQEDTPIEVEISVNSLPAEQADEELEKLIQDLTNKYPINKDSVPEQSLNDYYQGLRFGVLQGVRWQKEQTINKACEWLRYCIDTNDDVKMIDGEPEARSFIQKNLHRIEVTNQIVAAFKKAMEQ